MMKSLIINKPEDPIDYLIKSLEQTEPKRYVVIGPPGSESHDISLRMVEQLKENAGGIECVNLGDKFNSEMTKR